MSVKILLPDEQVGGWPEGRVGGWPDGRVGYNEATSWPPTEQLKLD